MKSKSNNIQLAHRFSSDTKIFPMRNYTLFGDSEIEEVEFSNNQQESDYEEDNGMANCIANNILDDAESPQHHRKKDKSSKGSKGQHEKDYDYGSVSSGSEKDDDNQIQVIPQPNPNSKTIPRKFVSHKEGFRNFNEPESAGLRLSNRGFQHTKQYSPDFEDIKGELKKENQGYNSSKIVPTTTFEPIFPEQHHRMSPEKHFDRHYSTNMMNQHLGHQQNFPAHFKHQQPMYPYQVPGQMSNLSNQSFPINYHPMPMSAPYPFYAPPYVAGSGPVNQPMKNIHPNMLHKQSSLSDKHLYVAGLQNRQGGSQNFSNLHGAPGLMKQNNFGEHASSKTAKPKQLSSGYLNSAGLVPSSQKDLQNAEPSNPNVAVPQNLKPQKSANDEVTKAETTKTKSDKKKKKKKSKTNEKRRGGRLAGKLKFFDEGKKYGFMVLDKDESDMFVHYDDLRKTNIAKDLLVSSKNRYSMHFTFHVFEYSGKGGVAKKAVDIKLVSIHKIDPETDNEIAEPALYAKDIEPEQEITEQVLYDFFNS